MLLNNESWRRFTIQCVAVGSAGDCTGFATTCFVDWASGRGLGWIFFHVGSSSVLGISFNLLAAPVHFISLEDKESDH